jgi:hypothetical protein
MCEESVHHLQVLFKATTFYKNAKISDRALLDLFQLPGVQNAIYKIRTRIKECCLSTYLYILDPKLPDKIWYRRHALRVSWWASFCHIHKYKYISHFTNIQQNSVNLTRTGLHRCLIIKYSGLSNSTYTDLSSYGQFFATAPILGLYN